MLTDVIGVNPAVDLAEVSTGFIFSSRTIVLFSGLSGSTCLGCSRPIGLSSATTLIVISSAPACESVSCLFSGCTTIVSVFFDASSGVGIVPPGVLRSGVYISCFASKPVAMSVMLNLFPKLSSNVTPHIVLMSLFVCSSK